MGIEINTRTNFDTNLKLLGFTTSIIFYILFLLDFFEIRNMQFLSLVIILLYFTYISFRIGRVISKLIKNDLMSKKGISFFIGYVLIITIWFLAAIFRIYYPVTLFIINNLIFIFLICLDFYYVIKLRRELRIDSEFFKKILIKIKNYFKKNILFYIILLTILFRVILFFVGDQIGVDTYRINYFAYHLILNGYLKFNSTLMEMLQMVPYGQFPIPIVLASSFSVISSLSIEISILIHCIFLSTIGILGTWFFLKNILKLSPKLQIFGTIIYGFAPVFIKLTDWTITGRTTTLVLLPFFLCLFELILKDTNRNNKIKISFLLIITSFILLFSHRMFIICPIYMILRLIVNFFSNKILKDQISRRNIFQLILSIFSIIAFLIPFILYLANENLLIYQWFYFYLEDYVFYLPLTGDNLFTNTFYLFNNYMLLFIVRMTIVIPLLLIEAFSYKTNDLITKEKNYKIYLSMRLMALFSFLMLFRAMYIYQSFFIFYVILAVFGLKRIYSITLFLIEALPNKIKQNFNKINQIKLKTIFFSLIIAALSLSGILMDSYRFNFFQSDHDNDVTAYLNDNTRDLADYLNSNYAYTTFYSGSRYLSLQLSALSPLNRFLPNQPNIIKSYDFFDRDQKPIFNLKNFSFKNLYNFIFLPLYYSELINETEIDSISNYNLTSQADYVIPLLLKYDITHVLLVNGTDSDLFFSELNSIGFKVKTISIYTIIDLKLRGF